MQRARQRGIAGDGAEQRAGGNAEPEARRDARNGRQRVPPELAGCAQAPTNVLQITDGGGTSRPSDSPSRTANSQTGRERRPAAASPSTWPPKRTSRRTARLAAATLIGLRRRWRMSCRQTDMAQPDFAIQDDDSDNRCYDRLRRSRAAGRSRPGNGEPDDQFVRATLVIDQRIDRRLHVDIGWIDAGLLQGDAGGEDRFALRRADLANG